MDANQTPPAIITVVGPTATGKTALAVELCHQLGGEIVGADSVQVYRHCDIGSGKPTADELQGIPHHLLDVLDPDQPIDAATFATLADKAIAQTVARGKHPIVVGGTGLWLRALLQGLVDLPPVDPELRQTLEHEWQQVGAAAMHHKLSTVDPEAAGAIHPNDQLRVVRALEVYQQTGKPLGALRKAHALGTPRYRIFGVCLDLPLPLYKSTVTRRVQQMLHAGLVAEVQVLLDRFGPEVRALSSVGYKQIKAHLQGAYELPQATEEMIRATEQYARRQRNWFRSDRTINLRTDPAQARSAATLDQLRRHLDPC